MHLIEIFQPGIGVLPFHVRLRIVKTYAGSLIIMLSDTGLACHYCVPQDMNALKCVSGLQGLRLNDLLVFRRRPSMPGVIADQLQLTCTVIGDRLSEVALSSTAVSSCSSIRVAIELAKYAQ